MHSSLKPPVALAPFENPFEIEEHAARPPEGADLLRPHRLKLAVRYGHDNCIVSATGRLMPLNIDAQLAVSLFGIDPRIPSLNLSVIFPEPAGSHRRPWNFSGPGNFL